MLDNHYIVRQDCKASTERSMLVFRQAHTASVHRLHTEASHLPGVFLTLAVLACQASMQPRNWCIAAGGPQPGARQPKVADLEVAGRVEQQVAGLQVAVQHVGCVHVLQPPQYLQSTGAPLGTPVGLPQVCTAAM